MDRETFKLLARTLRARSAAQGHEMSVGESLERLARGYGHRDWNTASALMKRTPEAFGEIRDEQLLDLLDMSQVRADDAAPMRHFSHLPTVHRLHRIGPDAFGDAELAEKLEDHLEDILRDLGEVRPRLAPLTEDPAVQDLIAALQDVEGDGWLACLKPALFERGRWLYLPYEGDIDTFAAYEDALAQAATQELSIRDAVLRKQTVLSLRFPETNGARPKKPAPFAERLSVLKARHADRPGFPHDLPHEGDAYEIQNARQLDRLETTSLQSQIDWARPGLIDVQQNT